jgi:serine/threonine protein phosphatase PrpC
MTHWTIAAFTHRGRVRPANEDAVAVDTHILTGDMSTPVVMTTPGNGCLLMVADGMGGHAQGAMASRAVLDHLVAAADRLSNPESCADAIEGANQHLYALMQQHEAALGMGSTLVGTFLAPPALLTFNVGDSRCYLFSAGRLIQLSHDDTADEVKTRSGHRRSHAITQALGGSSFPITIEPHINVDAPLGPDETLLLCTDGLTDMVNDQSIAHTLSAANDPTRVVRDLAGKAFAAGARDNVSLIVARHSERGSS